MDKKVADLINELNTNKGQKPQDDTFLKWDNEDRFFLTGVEFSTLVNTLKDITGTREFLERLVEARQTLAIAKLQELMNVKVEKYKEIGQIRVLTKDQLDKELERDKKQQSKMENIKAPVMDQPITVDKSVKEEFPLGKDLDAEVLREQVEEENLEQSFHLEEDSTEDRSEKRN